MVCLDSDIIIDALRNEKKIVEKVMQLRKDTYLTTTSINTFELLKGIFHTKNEKEKTGLQKFLVSIKMIPFNFEAPQKAAEIFEALRSKGQPIELTDVMIATICMSNNEYLLTKNSKHFAKIEGLKLESI